jgi:rod shape-determining protein MreC
MMRLIWWLAAVMAVSLVTIFLSELGATDPVRNLSLTITAPVQSNLRDVASPVNNVFSGITDRGDLAEENDRLRAELERLQAQIAQQQDTQQRIQELEDALGVRQDRPEDLLKAASVIGEDTAGLKRFIAIDLGENDDVEEGMVVLSRNGSLIGTVSEIYGDFAWVRLITDPDSTVNTQLNSVAAPEATPAAPAVITPATPTPAPSASPPAAQASATPPPAASPTAADIEEEGPLRAVAKGELHRGILLDLIPSTATVSRGDLVVTSGHGGNYPRGLLLGTVEGVEERPQAPFKTATVEPAANLSDLDTVLVLVSFKPARLVSP